MAVKVFGEMLDFPFSDFSSYRLVSFLENGSFHEKLRPGLNLEFGVQNEARQVSYFSSLLLDVLWNSILKHTLSFDKILIYRLAKI